MKILNRFPPRQTLPYYVVGAGDVINPCQGFINRSGASSNIKAKLKSGTIHTFKSVKDGQRINAEIEMFYETGTTATVIDILSFDASIKVVGVEPDPTPPVSVPVADFTADVDYGDAPLTVNFTDLSTNAPTSWEWDFENDATPDSTDQNPQNIYSTPGTYDVKLTATNAAGSDSETKTSYITVNNPAPTTGNITNDYEASVSGGDYTFEHTHGAGDNEWLFVFVCIDGGYNGVSATYGGVSMTKHDTLNDATGFGGFGADVVIFKLQNPSSGANDVVISFGAAYSNKLSYVAISYTDCAGIEQTKQNKESASTVIQATFDNTVLENSTLLVAACVRGNFTVGEEIEIPAGTSRSLLQGADPSAGVNAGEFGFVRLALMSENTYTIETNHDTSNDGGIIGVEIKGM